MRFDTLEKYDEKLDELEKELAEMEEYIRKHPEKSGTAGNYEAIKYVYDIIKNDRLDFINQISEINLKMHGNEMDAGLSTTDLKELTTNFNEAENLTTILLYDDFDHEDLMMKSIGEGSYKITFTFQNPTEDDVLRKSPRKKGLMKIFDFINCGDDTEKLIKEAGPNGHDALISYKEFLAEIIKHDADFTLDTEMGVVKACLTLEQSKNICEKLNI